MKRGPTGRALVPACASVALLLAALASPTIAEANAETGLRLSAPRAGVEAPGPSSAGPARAAAATSDPDAAAEAERERLALTYGRTKAWRTAWVGFALTGVEIVLSGVWIAHAQPLGILEDLPPRIDPSYAPNLDGGAIASGAIAWASVIAFAPAIGRGGRFARMHPEVGRSIALRSMGWTSYALFVLYGVYLQTYAVVYTGSTSGMVGGAAAFGIGSLLLLSVDALLVARQAERLAEESGLASTSPGRRLGPLIALGSAQGGASLVVGAQGAF